MSAFIACLTGVLARTRRELVWAPNLALALVACGGGTADTDTAPVAAPLTIVSTEPGDGATSVAVGAALSLTYSQRMAEAPSVVLVGPSGKQLSGVITLSGPTATFTTYAPLAHYNDYTLHAEGGVGASGAVPDPAATAVRIGFRTAASTTQPAIAWGAPASLAFSAAEGGPPPPGQLITVVNAGGGVLGGLAVAGVRYGKGASGWVRSTQFDSAVAPAALAVDVDSARLARGNYFASIVVTAPFATNVSQSLLVTLEVR